MAFNWREYIRVEEVPQRYFDAEGKVRPEYNDMRGRLESERINLRLITAVLDQVSQIPEVQTLIQDGVRIAHVRWLQFRDLDGGPIPEDRRLEISAVGGSKGNFFSDAERDYAKSRGNSCIALHQRRQFACALFVATCDYP
jgi:hypothetical protein